MSAAEGEHWWFAGRREIIRQLIADRVPISRNLRILEAGCGTGGNLGMLREFGNVTAFEYDDEARSVSSSASGIDVQPGMLPDGIKHIEGPFDVIALLDVLEHVEDDEGSLRTLSTKLAPKGFLIITVPALQMLWSDHDEIHHHHRRYSRGRLEKVIRAASLEIEFVSYFNTLLFPLALLQRLASRFIGRQVANQNATPPKPVNSILARVFASERRLLKCARLPVGLSLCAICRLPRG